MRIISGTLKGRQINPPAGLQVRPTTDFAKEGLFGILHSRNNVAGYKVLDLFAGTGNITFEFISRGAASVLAVDNNFRCTDFIKKTALSLAPQQVIALNRDAFAFLDTCQPGFDIIFADPPYDLKNITSIYDKVFSRNLLNKNGWLIIEHSKEVSFAGYEYILMQRKYGKVNFSIFVQP